MHQYLFYAITASIGTGVLLFTLGMVLRFRKEPLGQTLFLYLLLLLGVLVVSLLETFAPTESMTLIFGKMYFLFFPFIPLVWFYFSLQFTGLLTSSLQKKMSALLIIPVITVFIANVPAFEKLFYQEIHYIYSKPYLTYKAVYAPWFWIHGVHSYVLLISGMIVVIRSYIGSRKIFRTQSLLIVTGLVLVLLVNSLYVFRVFPGWDKDYTSIAFAFSGVFLFLAMYTHRLLHLVPVARNLVIKNLEAAILVFDDRFRLVDFNLNAEKMFDLNESLLGMVPDNTIPKLGVFGITQMQLADIRERSFIKNRNSEFFNCKIKQIEGLGNHQIGTIVSINNITEHINLLEEKTNTVHQLEHTNMELKKTQQHMIHREKLASIGQISAGIAHELNNPLSYIKSNMNVLNRYRNELFPEILESLKKGKKLSLSGRNKLDEKIQDIGQIVDSSMEGLDRIIEVVRNLLRFARMDDSSLIDDYDLHEGLESAINITASEFRYDAEIIRNYGEIPKLQCRGNEINQVIINILANAAQAAREAAADSGQRQRIGVHTSSKNGLVTCIIENSGSEIPEEIREKIFEPFYTTKKPGKGTGLGLSIAWDIIVKRHNGSISVRSGDNKTSFIIELPVNFAFREA